MRRSVVRGRAGGGRTLRAACPPCLGARKESFGRGARGRSADMATRALCAIPATAGGAGRRTPPAARTHAQAASDPGDDLSLRPSTKHAATAQRAVAPPLAPTAYPARPGCAPPTPPSGDVVRPTPPASLHPPHTAPRTCPGTAGGGRGVARSICVRVLPLHHGRAPRMGSRTYYGPRAWRMLELAWPAPRRGWGPPRHRPPPQ